MAREGTLWPPFAYDKCAFAPFFPEIVSFSISSRKKQKKRGLHIPLASQTRSKTFSVVWMLDIGFKKKKQIKTKCQLAPFCLCEFQNGNKWTMEND